MANEALQAEVAHRRTDLIHLLDRHKAELDTCPDDDVFALIAQQKQQRVRAYQALQEAEQRLREEER